MDSSVLLTASVQLDPNTGSKLQQQFAQMEKNLKFKLPFANYTRDVSDFSREMDRANQRVITLGLAFQTLRSAKQVMSGIVDSTIEVEKAFIDINSVFNLTNKNMEQFGRTMFDISRDTSQSFGKVAEAAKEFSRQGLSAFETAKRTKDAMILTRLASLSTGEAVETLTATLNGFNKAGLDSTSVLNKLAAVDAAFAVSAGDLAQALSRTGSAAADAGVSFEELLGLITSVKQTTGREAAIIGNSFKTIFTRVERKDTLDAIRALGTAVEDTKGNILPATQILKNFADTYDKLTGSIKKQAAELVGGVYQINILKALVADLSKEYSIASQATEVASKANDDAYRRNELLNNSLDGTIERLKTTAKQIAANAGMMNAGPAKSFLDTLNTNFITKALINSSDKDSEVFGAQFANGFLKGLGNALLFGVGPLLVAAMSKVSFKTLSKVMQDFGDATQLSSKGREQEMIQAQIVSLYRAGGAALQQQLATMSSMTEQATLLKSLLQSARGPSLQPMAAELQRQSYRPRGKAGGYIPFAAGSYVPFGDEKLAIANGVGGASPSAQARLINGFNFGGGKVGPIVANTSEYIVPNFANGGSAIFNQDMIKKYGLPAGSMPVAAGGYIPFAADGGFNGGPVDVRGMGLRGAQGGVLKEYYIRRIENLMDKIYRAGSGEEARDLGKGIVDLTDKLSKTSKSKILETLGNQYSSFDRGLNLVAINAKRREAEMSASTSVFIPSGAGDVAIPRPGSIQKGGMSAARDYNAYLNSRYRNDPTYAPSAMAANQMLEEMGYKSVIMQGPLVPPPVLKKPSLLQRLSNISPEKSLGLTLGASTALGFLGGITPEGGGGTQRGIALGAASGAFSGAAMGVGLGSYGGLPGALIGGGIGALGGGIVGAANKAEKSYIELATELEESNNKIKEQITAYNEILRLNTEIINAQATNQPQSVIRSLSSQQRANFAKITNPEAQKILQTQDLSSLDTRRELNRIFSQGDANQSAKTGVTSIIGRLVESGGLFGLAGYDDSKKKMESMAETLAQAFDVIAKADPKKIEEIKKVLQTSPSAALEMVAKETGADISSYSNRIKLLQSSGGGGKGGILDSVLGLFGGGTLSTGLSLLRKGSTKGIENTENALRKLLETASELYGTKGLTDTTKKQDEAAIAAGNFTKSMSALADRLAQNAQITTILGDKELKINQIRQQAKINYGYYTPMEKARLEGQYSKENIQAEFNYKQKSLIESGQSSLANIAAAGQFSSASLLQTIGSLKDQKDFENLLRKLSTQKGVTEVGAGTGDPQFIKAISDTINALRLLTVSTNAQTQVTNEQTQALTDFLEKDKTYQGALEQYRGQTKLSKDTLERALQRREVPDIIYGEMDKTRIATLQQMYMESQGTAKPMSQAELRGRATGVTLNSEARQREDNANMIEYLLQNPDAFGAKYLTGDKVSAGLFGGAKQSGIEGKSLESMSKGFRSVFAGMKQDISDLSDLGQHLGATLESSLSGAFGDFVTGAKSAKDAFRSFTVSVLADASRAMASKAIQGFLGMAFGSFGVPTPAGATGGEFSGGAFRFAAGGTVPALLTGGEYYISPKAAKSIGYDTLRQINRYAEGGMVRGGSGVRDDVPAHLAPGSFIVKKSVVDRLGPQYFDSLVNNHVQKRFIGGMLMGALLGGGLGYAVGGKKGALIGAGIGAIGGGLYQNFAQTGSMFSSGSNSSMFSFAREGASSAASATSGATLSIGPSSVGDEAAMQSILGPNASGGAGAVAKTASAGLSQFQKMGLLLGGAGALGLAARAMAPKEPSANLLTAAQVPAYRASLESQQQDQFSKNAFAYLSINPQGGYSLGSFGVEPATRRWADGGEVGGVSNIGPTSSGSGQSPSVNVKIEINNNGQVSSSSSASGKDQFGADFGQKIEKAVRPIVQDEIVRQMRNDGIFMQRSRYTS